MKKALLFFTIAALLCSCTAEPAETTTTPTVAAPAESTTTAAATEAHAQTTPKADRGEQLHVNTNAFYYADVDPADLHFYKNEADDSNEFYYVFDYTYGFGTSVYDDSTLHPERFDIENYDYTPETEYVSPKPFEIKAGDTVGDYRIYSAHTMIAKKDMGYEEGAILETEIVLDGEYSFTGMLRFFYNEDYMIGAGDLQFIPTEPLTNFPLPIGFGPQAAFFSGNTAVYSELMRGLRTGNFFTEESGAFTLTDEENNIYTAVKFDEPVLAELNRMLSGEKNDCEKHVEVTLSNVTLTYSEQFGSARSKAVITGIKEIK
ncbi:MAG: hypothetical protein K2N29_01000 [Ruminiclostridium sp.]|nr:hypothetical protein [Ruminiclostridium sp.]